jgi:hypothetical protein
MLLPTNEEPPPLISLKTLLRALKNEKLPPSQRLETYSFLLETTCNSSTFCQ